MNWQFARRPKWLVGHVLIVALSALMLYASAWQFDRLEGRKADNVAITAALTAPAVDVSGGLPPAIEEYRRVSLSATPVDAQTAYVRYPIQNGQSGFYVVTLYRLGDGTSLAVVRGWTPADAAADDSIADVPPAPLRIEGLVRRSETTDEPVNRTSGVPPVQTVAAVDTEVLQRLFPTVRLADRYVEVVDASQSGALQPITAPAVNEGSHFSYALQWLAFTAIALVGYAVLLVRTAKDR